MTQRHEEQEQGARSKKQRGVRREATTKEHKLEARGRNIVYEAAMCLKWDLRGENEIRNIGLFSNSKCSEIFGTRQFQIYTSNSYSYQLFVILSV